ncbi:MAG TPA: AMP-binding protein [Polyangiaceae bacterium]|nr:AMP-binding protein [Polyangiaceae bacterium]
MTSSSLVELRSGDVEPSGFVARSVLAAAPDLTLLSEQIEASVQTRVRFLEHGEWQEKSGPELARDVRARADSLRREGVEPGRRVGVTGPNTYAWIVADLALLELRAVSVAIPEHLMEDCETLAEEYDLSLVLAPRSWTTKHQPPSWVRYLDEDDTRPGSVRVPRERYPDPFFTEPTLAFSSGTTGKLKCLRVSRRGIEQVLTSFAKAFPIGPDDSVLVFLPLSNLQQRLMVYGALWLGISLVLATPQQLFRALKEGKPSIIIGPPALYETIHGRYLALPLAFRVVARCLALALRTLPSRVVAAVNRRIYRKLYESLGGRVHFMITGMAHIRRSTLTFFKQAGLVLFEAYGLTECGIVCSNLPAANRIGSVGRPFDPDSVRIANDGEIIVTKTHPLASGYLGEADAHLVFPDAHTVCTGDSGHFDADGFLYIDGRKKALLITSGGYKFHPEGLESMLNDCPVVERAAVLLLDGGALLCAVLTLRADSAGGAAVAQAFVSALNRRLPEAGRIGRVVIRAQPFRLEDGTLTRNLKLDRAAIATALAAEDAATRS